MADRYWGARSRYAYAWRTLMNHGTAIVFGSDSPIEAIEPLPGIYAAVTRTHRGADPGTDSWYPAERLTVDEAVRAFTYMAAYTARLEARLGSIEPGKLADLTIYDRDIYRISPAELAQTQIAGAIIGGQFKYRTF
jgi:predicted amidohydrolase YtcJ